uniref:TNF receptor-associated factor 4-like n=1 Tax=Sinocyclocheilus rhinocerous TaxID=307959 RepID=A0A673MBY7_9TELE
AFSIDNKFLEQQISMFYCPLCVKPMRDPVQMSTCGHRFCDTCLQEYLSEGVFKCPEDHLPLDYAKIFPDVELEQQILSLPIRCIHSEEGCRWTAQNKLLQAHLSVCEFNVVSCPNRCDVKLLRRELPEHLQHDCVKRKLHCDHCGDEFTGEAYESMLGFGYPKFLSHEEMRKRNYIRDNAIFIKASIDVVQKILNS